MRKVLFTYVQSIIVFLLFFGIQLSYAQEEKFLVLTTTPSKLLLNDKISRKTFPLPTWEPSGNGYIFW